MKFLVLSFSFALCVFGFTFPCYARDITILYTGDTHAMLYPCACPLEPQGGVARRATLINQVRKNNPQALLFDSGGFFAGGTLDEYTQNTNLDTQRTLVNLKAMQLMRYDAVCVGDDEFNFGRDFLEEEAAKLNFVFLSANLHSDRFKSFMIKEIGELKVGIIGLSNQGVMNKAVGVKYLQPTAVLKEGVEELKRQGAELIVLLSHLGESEDLKLIQDTGATIDVLVTLGHSRLQERLPQKIGSTIILRPSWQGRRLGKVVLSFKDHKIRKYKIEEFPLSDKVSSDPRILSLLPACFRDTDCKQKGSLGTCKEPGSQQARCQFNQAAKIKLLTIIPQSCLVCKTDTSINEFKEVFPGLENSYLYYPGAKANQLVKELEIKSLPAYLFGKEIEKESGFNQLREKLLAKGNFYLLKPQYSGLSFFIERKKTKGSIDLFISLFDQDTAGLLAAIKTFHPKVHFLAKEENGIFTAARGGLEVEEYLRAVCVQKYYPQGFWDYIACRAKNNQSSWWEDCLGNFESLKIKGCAKGQEAKEFLRENTRLNKELQIMFGPTYLLDNQEAFGTAGAPSEKDFKKIFKR